MSLYLGENKIADNTSSRIIGEIITSSIPLADPALHLLDGAVINGTGSYAKFVNYIAGLVSNYPDLFVSESDWQSAVTTYGVCGKFVYDSTNNTVRLPKITGFVEGTTDVTALGDLIEAGLPNIEGRTGSNNIFSDLFTQQEYQGSIAGGSYSTYASLFDASKSNSIYGNSSTVQPQSIKVLYYIVIATSITNELNLDVADLERSKADVDLSNVVNVASTFKEASVGWGMPDYSAQIVSSQKTNYEMPFDGYIQAFSFHATDVSVGVTIGDITYNFGGSYSTANGFILPVSKGEIITLNLPNNGSFIVIPCLGV